MAVTKDHWTLDFRYYNLLWYWYSHFSPFRTLQLGHGGLWDSERLVAEGGRDGEGDLWTTCSCGDFAARPLDGMVRMWVIFSLRWALP